MNLILQLNFGTNSIIAKGYFYDILAPSENKGFDSFHIIETDNQLQLWFGEVKFHQTYQSALTSIFANIEKIEAEIAKEMAELKKLLEV